MCWEAVIRTEAGCVPKNCQILKNCKFKTRPLAQYYAHSNVCYVMLKTKELLCNLGFNEKKVVLNSGDKRKKRRWRVWNNRPIKLTHREPECAYKTSTRFRALAPGRKRSAHCILTHDNRGIAKLYNRFSFVYAS